jgi:glucoamylase
MLPEQVWDFDDLPAEGMYFGRSAGSAQPLVWAHAEYIKLLRSVVDGKVFDHLPLIANRYGVPKHERTFESRLEIFKLARPISAIMRGSTLRIQDSAIFRVIYTFDNWATQAQLDATSVGILGAFADIPTTSPSTDSNSDQKIIFTLYWPGTDHWLGRNYEVTLSGQPMLQPVAADKPKS